MRSIQLYVDLTDAPRRLTRVVADLPVRPNTTASFTTPLWLCASYMRNGPVDRISNLFFKANNDRTVLKWHRDATQLHIYHVEVPSNVTTIRASFDALLRSNVTRRMAMATFESFMMHPAYSDISRIPIQATIRILPNWDYATSLRLETEEMAADGAHKTVTFQPVTTERLEDSPVLIGQHLSQCNITKDGMHQLCIAFSEPELTKIPSDRIDKLQRMIEEVALVFGPGPYRQYKFLVLASDKLVTGASGGGIEHAESTHILTSGGAVADDETFDAVANVFSHEYVHVWNGKYRRPVGHVPRDFTSPLDGTLLWVYEGLTHYYGYVLAARSGLSSRSTVHNAFAVALADMQSQSGRAWRSTEDTARGVALRTMGAKGWDNALRATDYYDEGILFWLDADTLIREQSRSAKTLDDFARKFFDVAGATQPLVVPYTLDEVISTLNETLPYDWAGFISERVQTPQAQVNTAGFERAGYKFAYVNEPRKSPASAKERRRAVWHSIGLRLGEDGSVSDVRRFSKADAAGLAPSQTITHVGGKEYSLDELTDAIAATRGHVDGQVRLTVTGDEETWDAAIEHSVGLLYPTLERQAGSDMLTDIFKPRATNQ
ncbi:hypothetical protein NLG97_g1294 [Lecanicillium saksenae]|uniref:Uncharacterized protein n=1 Tax=Lecanicillium saksenae TaxID=468837 RepID=A0ACC1R4T1_9HYPO|nr:hypothetical protein NLG97_g1294 [Lecanicillium saksenae]